MNIRDFKKLIIKSKNFNVNVKFNKTNKNIFTFDGNGETDSQEGRGIMTINELSKLMLTKFEQMESKFEAKFEKMDVRLNQMDTKIEKVNVRLNQMETKFEQMKTKFENRFDLIDVSILKLGNRIDNLVIKNNLIEQFKFKCQ